MRRFAAPDMRIGELLLERGWIERETLALAVRDQRRTRLRLCSILVAQNKLDFDHASRALGEQLGTAAVLRRHLEQRDRGAAALLSPETAIARVALPIGRLGNGALIICVRDPSPALHTLLSRELLEPIVLAVAPARYIERLVADTYAPRARDEIAVLDTELLEDDDDAVGFDFDIDVDAGASGDDLAFDVSIDVDEALPAVARPTNKPLPVQIKPLARPATAPPDSLDATLAACKDIDEADWLFDVSMQYISRAWTSSLLLAIRGARAVGVRGHGKRLSPAAVRTFVATLADAVVVQRAREERRIIDELSGDLGSDHEELAVALEIAGCPVAVPLRTADDVTHVLVLGEPTGDREEALVDIGLLADAMSEALSRM